MNKAGLAILAGLASVSSAAAEENPFAKYGLARAASGTDLKPPIIPAQFRGEWNGDLKACGTGLSDTRLRIFAQRVSFYESDGDVKRVLLHNGRAITVSATYAGEGEIWDRVDKLILSRSSNELTVTSADTINTEASTFTRYRCPIKSKKR